MILSDRSIREEIEAGRIEIDPFDPSCVQPSSIDLHVDDTFRVFHNARHPYIDVKQEQPDLTEVLTVSDGEPFILHPGEFVLGSTLERVRLPDDLVARLEGKSSLGRLGLLIHSSLPGPEPLWLLRNGELMPVPIWEVVKKRLGGAVVSFDPQTFEVGYHDITGWYEGPEDRIFDVVLASGRRIALTAGHNLFSLGRAGELRKVPTAELRPGTRVAIPREIPTPPGARAMIDILAIAAESAFGQLVLEGPTVRATFRARTKDARQALRAAGYPWEFWMGRSRLPLDAALLVPGLIQSIGESDRVGYRGSRRTLPAVIDVDRELAWVLGLYAAEGSRRHKQVVVSNTNQAILSRAEQAFAHLGFPVYRTKGAVVCCSTLLSAVLGWYGASGLAPTKRIPSRVFGWPEELIEAFLEGLVDGDGSREPTRTSVWTSSPGLAGDVLALAPRLRLRASASFRQRGASQLFQISIPHREHKLLTSVPLPDALLIELRRGAGLRQNEASRLAGFKGPTDLNNIERRSGRDAVRLATLRRLRAAYASAGCRAAELDRLVDGGLLWDRVREVRDTGSFQRIYDIEVRPSGRKIENFMAGYGGVFVSNTAGYVDPGWDGYLTLELSNVANLPITIYPGMKIGQISFFRLSTAAETPYGSDRAGSKYQGQRGPTASRFFEEFRPR